MGSKFLFLILLSASAGFFSCEKSEKVDDYPIADPQPVLNCFFSKNEEWSMELSKSLSVLDNAPLKKITNAKVLLYENGVLVDSAFFNGVNYTTTKHLVPKVGNSYSVVANFPKLGVAKASDKLVQSVPLSETKGVISDTLSYEMPEFDHMGIQIGVKYHYYYKMTVGLTFNDPASEPNYYLVQVFSLDTDTITGDIKPVFVSGLNTENPAIENNEGYADFLAFSDQLFNGRSFSLQFDFSDNVMKKIRATPHKVYYVKLTSMGKARYLYEKTKTIQQNAQGDPFAEPANVYNNIEGGFGIFAGFDDSYKELIY